MKFVGYHGTSELSTKKILEGKYNLSIGDIEWLGDGVYFFINGVSSKPDIQAEKWSIASSWDKINRKYQYNNYCVLKSNIEVDDNYLLDLTNEDGIEILSFLAEKFNKKIAKTGRKLNCLDGLLINLAREENLLRVDIVKGNVYIKFTEERIRNINLRTSNSTICSVYNSECIIDSRIVKTGKIKEDEIN